MKKNRWHNAANAATKQRYLLRWARWWQTALEPISINHLLLQWVLMAQTFDLSAVWLGWGLLPWSMCRSRLTGQVGLGICSKG